MRDWTGKRVAVVHDWLTGMRGGEKVLEGILSLFPQADVFTLVLRREKISPAILRHRIFTSKLQHWPLGKRAYRHYLPLYRHFMRGFDLVGYDLIVSSSSACAKWVRTPAGVPHVCYCHSPMRYIWGSFDEYFGANSRWPIRLAARFFRPYLQKWDLESNAGVTHFLANSSEVQQRIQKTYRRTSRVIHPPVEVRRFRLGRQKREYFLVLSALVPYKRVDLAVQACQRLGLPLVVAGEGPERQKLEKMAGSGVRFLGWVSDEALPALYQGAKALLFPGKEDFGIVPVEALAAGCPVIALGEGGVLDSLEDGRTGFLFKEQSLEAMEDALSRFQRAEKFSEAALRRRAEKFSQERFLSQMRHFFKTL